MATTTAFDTEEGRWDALVRRDPGADGAFYYGVRTTGVYCRPGCASRRPRRENVAFFDSPAAAERAGYRPCRRCRPDGPSPQARHAERIEQACRWLEAAESAPTLAELAAAAGLSRWHFQRLFKATLGVTPRQYFASARAQRFRERLRTDASVTDAVFAAGFGSSSAAHACADTELAMTPSAYRAGAAGEGIGYGTAPCSLGWVAVALTARGVCAIELGDDPQVLEEALRRQFPRARLEPAGSAAEAALRAVVALVECPGTAHELPLDIQGSAFRRRVWQALRALAPGETVSYADIAARIGRPGAARAVAGACAANPLAVAIPCHRVVRADGGLGGYRWGIERKRALLARERGAAGADDHSSA